MYLLRLIAHATDRNVPPSSLLQRRRRDRSQCCTAPPGASPAADRPNDDEAIPDDETARNGLAVLGQHQNPPHEEGQEAKPVDEEAEAVAADLAAKGLPTSISRGCLLFCPQAPNLGYYGAGGTVLDACT